jgi:hypothetical protein
VNWAYGITIVLSALVAVAELFSKFRDEPFYVLRRGPGICYVLFNVLIAVIALILIAKTGFIDTATESGWIKGAFAAGLGSTVLMRSKFFKITMNGKELAIGPEFIINLFLETLEKAIDRERALTRKKLVEHCMAEIDFNKAHQYSVTTIIASSQTASDQSVKKLIDDAEKIEKSSMGEIEKSFALGYLILDNMGEKFLQHLFQTENRERFLKDPPLADTSESLT